MIYLIKILTNYFIIYRTLRVYKCSTNDARVTRAEISYIF